MKIKVFLFRHGETDWNQRRKFQGHTDIPLNENGKTQALSLQEKVRRLNWQAILCSDLIRAKETAAIAIEGLKIPTFFDARLRETNLGKVEGLTQEEIIQTYGEDLIRRWRSISTEDHDFMFPGGESKRMHQQRSRLAIDEFIQKMKFADGSEIGVSTHGGTLVRIIHGCSNAPKEAIVIPNCVMYEVERDLSQDQWLFVRKVD